MIHNAATVCRFCKESVPGHFPVALGWQNFASCFHRASRREQWDSWQELGDEDRCYAQKVLGVESPERFEFTFGLRKRAESTPQPVVALGRSQLWRLLTGYMLLFIISLALVAGVMLLRSAEVPSLASRGFILSTSTISQNLDQGLTIAYEKLAVSARDVVNSTLKLKDVKMVC